jgi:hypothetical protein
MGPVSVLTLGHRRLDAAPQPKDCGAAKRPFSGTLVAPMFFLKDF